MLNGKPLCIDGFCGLGGWSKGFLAEGYHCVGFDLERHDYGSGGYPGDLVIQDVLTLHGSQFKDADCLVFSPPCQAYSYMAMPWKRGKALAAWRRESPERIRDLNALFDACFRLQLEASKAAGRYIPLVVENVKGAQPWVGKAKAHYGSYYLWGDVESVGGRIVASGPLRFGMPSVKAANRPMKSVGPQNEMGLIHRQSINKMRDSLKVTAAVESQGIKVPGNDTFKGTGQPCKKLTDPRYGAAWFDGEISTMSSKSNSRKAASAAIAEIPVILASHIARIFKPMQNRKGRECQKGICQVCGAWAPDLLCDLFLPPDSPVTTVLYRAWACRLCRRYSQGPAGGGEA